MGTDSRRSLALVAAALPLAAVLFYLSSKRKSRRRKGEPPLETGWLPFIGVGFEFLSDYAGLIRRLRAKHGSVFTIINFGQRMTFVTDMPTIRAIWKRERLFSFHEFGQRAEADLGGLAHATCADTGIGPWTLAIHAKEMRSPERLEELAGRFRAGLEELPTIPMIAASAGTWQECNLLEFCGVLIFFAGGKSLFGPAWCKDTDVRAAYNNWAMFEEWVPLIAGGLPKYITKAGNKARDNFVQNILLPALKTVLAAQQANPSNIDASSAGAHPYLARYVFELSRAHPGDPLTVAKRLVGVNVAILTNTILFLHWVIARLLTIPDTERKAIHEEIVGVGKNTRYADLRGEMPRFSSLMVETLRSHGYPNSFRVVKEDTAVKGTTAEALSYREGDQVFLLAGYAQMEPNSFVSDPDTFDALRWQKYTSTDDAKEKVIPAPKEQVLEPFGGGKHLCPGRFFAMLEMQLATAWVIAHFDFELVAGAKLPAKVDELSSPINMPKQSFRIRFRLGS